MKISIIIPCVDKHLSLVEKLLETMKLYTRKPEEVIVSVSPKFLNLNLEQEKNRIESKYENVTILVQKTITNTSVNSNKCIEKTTGDIVILCPADDVMHPQKLEIMEKLFTRYRETKLILHRFKIKSERDYSLEDFKHIDIDENKIYTNFTSNSVPGNYPPVIIKNYDYKKIKPEQPYASGFIAVKKDVFEKIIFKNISTADDSLFITDVHNEYDKTLFFDECLYDYTPSYSYK